jgi:uncharacterized protein (DUF362 family)
MLAKSRRNHMKNGESDPGKGGSAIGKSDKIEGGNLTRRDFLKSLSGAAAAAVVLGACDEASRTDPQPETPQENILAPRSKATNVFVNNAGKPILVCVTGRNFELMLAAGLAQLGGLSRLIAANQDVLIKPNCNAVDEYPGISEVNSLVSIVKEVKKVTSGTVSVGDQGYHDSSSVYPHAGIDPLVEQAGAKLLDMEKTYQVKRSGWSLNVKDFKVYSEIYDAPVILNTGVLKRHHTAGFSCAIKNNVGTVAGPGATSTRHYLHYDAPDFCEVVAEIAGAVNPELNIIDARTILTVQGPSSSAGVPVDVNKLILCGDIVATDTYCERILSANDDSPVDSRCWGSTSYAEALGLGTSDLSKVEIVEITV